MHAEQCRHEAFDAFQRIADGARLFEDFLLHVMTVRAEIDGAGIGMDGQHRALDRLVVQVGDGDAVQPHVDHVAFAQIDDLVGGAGQRHRIRRQEIFAVAETHHQRAAQARADQAVRFVPAEYGQRKRAFQTFHGFLHCAQQIAVVQMIDQMRDGFGIGLRFEAITQRDQFGADLLEVFDDAVVHQRDARRAAGIGREMRMGVDGGRRAVGGPACMRDAGGAAEIGGVDLFLQFRHARHAARALEAAVRPAVVHRHAAGIIAAVFEPPQALQHDGNNIALRYCTDDTAHGISYLLFLGFDRARPAVDGDLFAA